MTQERAIELARRLLEENRAIADQAKPTIAPIYVEAIQRLIITAELDQRSNPQ